MITKFQSIDEKDRKQEEAVKEIGRACLRTGVQGVSIDTSRLGVSRSETEKALNEFLCDINDALNRTLPSPFFFDVCLRPKEGPIPARYEAFFRMSLVIHPLRELIYQKMKKIPYFGQFVAGPKIVTHLFLSERQEKAFLNG